jgi:excinuclease ABC subunit C
MAFTEPETIEIVAGDLDRRLESVPDRAAVFQIWPRQGPPYLARTNVLRRRLKRLLGERTGASRMLNLRSVASRVEYWFTGSRLEAGLLFYKLALQHFPETYLELLKLRMPHYVKVILSNPFPRTQVTTRLGSGASLYFGPFRTRASAELFESQALDLFQVRRCQEDLEPRPDHPGCIYGEMNMCLRPCQQAVSPAEYRSEVDRLVQFLETEGRSATEPLAASRDRLSEEMDFEAAARQHKQLEKVQQVLRLRDELAREIGSLHGVAVTQSAAPGSVELWFVAGGCWQPPVRFGFEIVEGKTISLDHRLREVVAGLDRRRPPVRERQEHLALLARWYYSSWRDGEWLPFDSFDRVPYRKLVRAISRIAAPAPQAGKL